MLDAYQKKYQKFMSRMSRIPGSNRLVPELESLRFVAIASVFMTHLNGYLLAKSQAAWAIAAQGSSLDKIFQQGGYGVQLFFVISGFVLALPFARQRLDLGPAVQLGSYYLRRLTRLEPPYLVCLGILFLALVFYNHQPAQQLIPHLAASAVYLHAAIYQSMSSIDPVTWSLEVEVQFYLLAPLLTLIFMVPRASIRRAILLAGCLLFQALQLKFGWDDDRNSASLLNYLPYFLIGFVLVELYLSGWLSREPRQLSWDFLSLAGWPLIVEFAMCQPSWMPLVFPWSLLLLFVAFFRGRFFRWMLSGTLPITIGGMCYSIYLFHQTLISAVARFTKNISLPGSYAPNFLIQALITGAAVLFLSGIFYLLIERPCMRRDWPQRLSSWLKQNSRLLNAH